MARIHYGLAGEGRGHAVRARTLLEALQADHELVVHAPGDAFSFLAPLYAGHPRVEVREVPGLRWSYSERGRVAFVRSGLAASGKEARRLIAEGGARLDDEALTDSGQILDAAALAQPRKLSAGRKRHALVKLEA